MSTSMNLSLEGFSAFENFKTSSFEEVSDTVKNTHFSAVIGRSRGFEKKDLETFAKMNLTEEEVRKRINQFLTEQMKARNVLYVSYGADYHEITMVDDECKLKRSIMATMIEDLPEEFEIVAITHPKNMEPKHPNSKFIPSKTVKLTKSAGDGWGGHDGNLNPNGSLNPTGATRITCELMDSVKSMTVFVVSGGPTTAQELEVYHSMNVPIIMLDLGLNSPAEEMATKLGIKMTSIQDI